MRRPSWIRLVVTIVGIVGTVAGTVSAQPTKTVRDPLDRFTIAVPSTWTIQTSVRTRDPAVTAKAPTAPVGRLPDSVYVISEDLAVPVNARGCVVEADRVMRFTIHDWKTVHEAPTTLGGLPAYTRTYTWRTSTGETRYSVQTCVTSGRRAFMVVATTADTPSVIQRDLPGLEQIMATLRPNMAKLPPSEAPGSSNSGQK